MSLQDPRVRALLFAAVLFALTAPAWMLNGGMARLAPGIPASALAVACPALAAWIVERATRGRAGAAAWWGLSRPRIAGLWNWRLLFAVALPIGVAVVSMMWRAGETAPQQRSLAPVALLAFVPAALIGAWLEETGWSALAAAALLTKWSPAAAALTSGPIWALWHLIPLAQVGRSPTWIAWWIAGTLAMRMTLVWVYTRSGRDIRAPSLFHASDNVCWQAQLTLGVGCDPRLHALRMAGVAVIVMTAGDRRWSRT